MTTGKIKTLFSDVEKTEALFPQTKVEAISDKNGKGLGAILENYPTFGETEGAEDGFIAIDADSLGGLPSNQYASKAYVREKITEAQVGSEVDLSNFVAKEELDKIIQVTPQMFGAVGDGITDDTIAIKAAIASGSSVFFPKGTYLVTETLIIDGGVCLRGAGITVSTIKYTGNDYLFHIKAEYKNHPVIEKINFVGGANNSFIKCISNDGSWGGCFTLRDFHVQYFNVEWLRLISAFKVLIENGSFKTLGKCVMTTWNELPTTSNFNNCITFRNTLISCPKYGDGDIPVMFELFNTREIWFENCALEHCEIMFKDFVTEKWQSSSDFSVNTNNVKGLKLNECWLETVGALYSFSYDSDVPITTDCKFVNIAKYDNNLSEKEPDHLQKANTMYLRNGETSSIEAAFWGTEKVIHRTTIINEDDTQGDYFYPHLVTTKQATFNVPINTDVVQVNNDTTVKRNIKQLARQSKVSCIFRQKIIFVYKESVGKSVNIWEAEWMCYDKSYYLIKEPVRVYSYGSGQSATAVETVAKGESGQLVATTDTTAKTIAIVTEYSFNGIIV